MLGIADKHRIIIRVTETPVNQSILHQTLPLTEVLHGSKTEMLREAL